MLRWFIAAALFAAAAWSGFRAWADAQKVKAVRGWTRVPATITQSRVEEATAYNADSGEETVFEPKVAYAYEVNGVVRSGSRLSLGPETCPTRGAAQKRLADYAIGAKVEALVDPANPANSCLAAYAHLNLFAPVAFSVIGVIAASGLLGG